MSVNATTVRNLYEAFRRGDIPTVLGMMDAHIDWREPEGLSPMYTDQTGPDAVLQNVFGTAQTVFHDFSVNASEILDAGDAVVGLGVYRGVVRDTGRNLAADFAHVWRFGSNGKITGFRTYTDTHLWREALGMNQRGAASSGTMAQ